MKAPGNAIGLFGGTFDPVHNGHRSIAESFLGSGLLDELHVLLTPSPPHKPDEKLTPYAIRLQMLRAAFEDMEAVTVSDLEQQLPKPSYTLQTVSYLKKKHPGHSYFLCIGEDSYHSFESWHKWYAILEQCQLLVARRPSANEKPVAAQLKKRSHFVSHQPVAISSTEVRRMVARGEPISDLVPPSVLQLITDRNLYLP